MIDLSILICSTHTRWNTFGQAIQKQVWDQYNALPPEYQDRIEILMLTDNKKMMLGHKRNVMVDMAQGRYVQFIDDDDRIEPDMFKSVLDAMYANADVVSFWASVSINGEDPKICVYSKRYEADRNTAERYERLPNHICAIKRELAVKVSFPNLPYGEDSAYSKLLLPLLRSETCIERVLYHYDYNSETTETQQHLRAPLRMRDQEPVVDVIILSNATTPDLYDMTQNAIDTCIAGANSLPVHVIVMEQQKVPCYDHATTVGAPGEFRYNAFANRGARYGHAEWIMVANNDLVFRDGWLHQLLAANMPVVSPKAPGDMRQADITKNAAGYVNGRHFSGWCFMIRRSLWEKIGGFDTCVDFWCSDDVVIEQVKALGIIPTLVVDSVVEHLGSVTLNRILDPSDLTWKQVDIFNTKYGQNKFADDERFQEWKKDHESAQ